jgi:ribonuclease-3
MLKLKERIKALADLATLQQTLGVSFNDPSLLEQALVHSSYSNENPGIAPADNERLEFLGDAILGFIVAEDLYKRFPQFSEGELTKLRSSLVRRDALARMARAIKLGNYLYLGKGEEASGGRRKTANLAGALEALIAAIFFDRGLAAARDFILRSTDKVLNKALSKGIEADYKSRLQEITQAKQQKTPAYRVIEAVGPAHDRRFTVEVRVGNTVLGRGSGKSKKSAEAEAARSALAQISTNFTP